ncbi:MAG: ABC transporter ATP-binding protein [Symbiobacteriia bacterium]
MVAVQAGVAPESALDLKDISIRFGRLQVLENVSLAVPQGERRGILGPNGAGKTTLFNVVAGELAPTSGAIRFFGSDITPLTVHRRAALGLCRTFQTTTLFPKLTAVENVLLALQVQTNARYQVVFPRHWNRGLEGRARDLLDQAGLGRLADRQVRFLSHGEQRQIEILLAVAQKPRLLLLDEPTAGLAPGDVPLVTNMLKALGRDVTMILIEHDMSVVFELVDKITVLHYGKTIAEDTVEGIRRNPLVQEIYLGGKL